MHECIEIRGAKSSEVGKYISLLDSLETTDSEVAKYKLLVKARYPYFPPEQIRVVISGNEILSALLVFPEFIQLGEARLRVGVLGRLFTSPLNNKRGVGSRLIRDSVAYLEKQKFNLALVFDVPRFYQRFGFVPAFFESYRDLKYRKEYLVSYVPPPFYRVRRIKPADIPIVQKIHDQLDENTFGSVLRAHFHYSLKWNEYRNSWVIYDAIGKVHGYFCTGFVWKQIMTIKEIGCIGKDSMIPVVNNILNLANRFGCKIIRFLAPPDYVIFNWLEELGIKLSETSVSKSHFGMVKILNLEDTFECLTPEWEKKLHGSVLRNKDVEVTFIIDSQPFNIYSRKGNISISNRMGKNKVSLDKEDLALLILGSESGEDWVSNWGFGISDDAKNLIKIMFPKRFPYIWYLDRL
ncbi:MAG: GNAT family N-acetyltransferase [Candidatus Hydrogenedentes bacterium]|nr:GNAT family N-acetyltransferase [Candidatus Hydrogenedentota bacterium]